MNKILPIIVAVCLLFNVSSAFAQQEYEPNENLWIDAGLFRDQMAQHAPRVACNPNNPDDCAVVYYFSNDTFGGMALALRWTYNGFESIGSAQIVPQTFNYQTTVDLLSVIPNYALPFDITWFDGKYWIVFKASPTSLSYIYTWDVINGFVLNSTRPDYYDCIEIVDEYTNDPKFICIHHSQSSNVVYYDEIYLINNSVHIGNTAITSASCYSVGIDYIFVRGFWEKSGTTHRYNVDGFLKCGVGAWTSYSSANLGTFNPSGYDGIWYWDGARLFFRTNDSVRYQPTTDLTNFGDIIVYHTFNTSYEEYINYTDDDIAGVQHSFVFRGETNITGRTFPFEYRRGIFASQQTLKMLNIYPNSLDLNDGSVDDINISAILSCDDFEYTTNGYGNSISLITPCENNTLTLIAPSGFEPFSTTVNDIQLTDECSTTSIVADKYLSEYDLEVRTRDLVFYTPIDGVLINVGGTTNTTDALGIATIPNFFPVTDSNFIRGSKVGCAYHFTFDGIPDTISVSATKTGYETFTTTETFAETPFDDPFSSFTRDYLIEMQPPSTEIEVKAYTLDNVEIESSSSQILVSVYGAENVFLFDNGNYYEQDTSSEIPSQFLLVDNRSSWSVNVTLDFYGQHYQQNASVVQGGFKTIKFTVNYTSNMLPCETNLDCPASFCDGKYYKKSKGCIANLCEYKTEVCKSSALCDSERGCFDAQGTSNCEDDTDCITQSYCLTSKKSRTGLCGSKNICIFKDMICIGDCNSTTGLCYESDLCLLLGQIRHRFLIQTTTQPYIEGVYTTYVDADYYCGIENRGERECINGVVVPSNPSLVGITTLPDNWQGTVDENGNYVYYDISILCDNLCNITYEYCEYGCNDETGFCHHAPTETAGQIKGWMDSISQMWWTFFPNIASSTLGWILLSLGVSVLLGVAIKESGGQIFLGSMISMVGAGAVVGVVINWFSLAFIIVSGFLLWKFYRGV